MHYKTVPEEVRGFGARKVLALINADITLFNSLLTPPDRGGIR
jgi:hypothetical protein